MPSILDGLPKTDAEMREITVAAATAFSEFLATNEGVTPKARSIVAALDQGLSLADVLGITKEQREAVLVQGFQQLSHGDHAGAQNTLSMLYHLEPTDERVIYALAATHQAQEDYAVAGKLYLNFLALDATNPQGYLRLAECFMANREIDEARAYFEAAKVQAAGTPAAPDVDAYADRMTAALDGRAAA